MLSINTNSTYTFATNALKRGNVFYCKITADIHRHSIKNSEILGNIYSEMILSGAGSYSRIDFRRKIDELGASISVNITDGKVTFKLKCQGEAVKKLLQIVRTMIEKPTFSVAELSRVKKNTKNELSELSEDARYLSHQDLRNALYSKSDRRQMPTIKQLQQTIPKLRASDLRLFHKAFRNSFWCVRVASGKTEIKQLESLVKKVKKHESLSVSSKIGRKTTTSTTLCRNVPSKQNIELSIGSAVPFTLNHPDYSAFVFGLAVLGKWGGFAGRLMSTVREKEGLTYGIYAKTETITSKETGYWRIMTFFNPKDVITGLDSTFREIKNIRDNGITDSEFRRFKVILETEVTLLQDSYIRALDDLHNYACNDFSLKEIDAFRQNFQKLTRTEVNKALKKYLNLENIIISASGPIQKAPKELSRYTSGK